MGRIESVPTRVRWALVLIVLFHGGLLLAGSYRGTYDAYVHMFLGDHYARDWFSTWDQRWYTGFTTVSYPPGSHQALAAVSMVTGGFGSAFVIVQLAALLLLTIGVYRFSRLWVDREAAANAALLLAVSSSIAETVHVFGQLPTTFGLAFLLNSLPSIRRWAFEGNPANLVLGVVIMSAGTAAHHVTTLFGSVFFLGPVLVAGFLAQSRIRLPDEVAPEGVVPDRRIYAPLVARRLRRIWPSVLRTAVLAPTLLAALVIVVLPYWIWSGTDPISQIPIPHGSRANFVTDPNLGLVFFLIPWGLMLLVLPYALLRAVADRMWPLAASIGLLFVLGTGGTTPIPKLLLGPAFDILTLDRFTFWATIQILPLAGLFVRSLERGTLANWMRRTGGPALLRIVQVGCVVAVLVTALFSANLSRFRPFQPDPIDPDPIVAFIEKDQHSRWRFLTLGFGDQMAWLSAQTTATQVDGNYHSVRRLPELTSTSVERLEGAKYRGIAGLGSLQQFVEVPEKYHLKYVFSNDSFYDPLLHFSGWQRLGPLENGIVVWERADVEPLPAVLPVREVPPWQRFLWGTLPPAMVLGAIAALIALAFGALGRHLRSWTRPAGPAGWVDDRLRRMADRLADHIPEDARRRPDKPVLTRLRVRMSRPVSDRRRRLRLGAMALVAALAAPALIGGDDPDQTEVVEAYFDDLDFRRWESAYARLDPLTRPDYELWRLQLSVTGGILASYAKLDSMSTAVLERSADETVVRADLRYLTALDWYPVARDVPLVRRDGDWYVVPEPPDLTQPPDQLVRRPGVDYLIQGRRRVTSLTSELTDVQDRPELAITTARLVENDGLPVVVGEVVNTDIDPADITLTAVIRDADGEILGRYNATDHMLRTLLPRESSPFRIDFEEVAAGTNIDFDPLNISPIVLDGDIASVEVYAKAVVTQQGLYRGLQLLDLELNPNDAGEQVLDGAIRNDGVVEAVIPMALISFLDADGEVAWVERMYLENAIRSQRSENFSFPLPDLAGVSITDLEPKVFANGIAPVDEELNRPGDVISAGPGSPFVAIRIDLTTMVPPGASG